MLYFKFKFRLYNDFIKQNEEVITMNKIKLIYDVVKTMKEKNTFKGTLKAEGLKDEAKFFVFENVFERNNLTGLTKAKIKAEVDSDGKKMKMDNSMEFEGKEFHKGHDFMKHIHSHRHHGEHSGGLKEGLNKLGFILSILNNLKVEEQEDKSAILSLAMDDIPEEIKKAIHEKHQHGNEEHEKTPDKHHHHHLFMKEFHSMKKTDFKLNIFINANSEIEKITLLLNGEKEDEKTGQHAMKLDAEVCLDW
jgi:hypothetical protein